MRQLFAFTYKEYIELLRTGKLQILMILFILFGIMNPAIAKLTPWLMNLLSGSLSDAGLSVTGVQVDALTSWTQFYKNIPIAFIIFLLVFSGILTFEYQKGTLINMITKGMERWKIIASKYITLISLWTVLYWICYVITYVYNAYYWDNHIACHLFFSALCFYLFGVWLISLIPLISTCVKSNSAVIIISGSIFLVVYLLGLLPDLKKFLPARLWKTSELLFGISGISEYKYAIIITSILIILDITLAILRFNKSEI